MKGHLSATVYLYTYVALIVLATVSLLGSFISWRGELVVSMVVATVKSLLVAWIFMHLAEQRFANRMVVLVSAVLLSIFIGLTTLDVLSRKTFPPRPVPASGSLFYR